MKRRVHSREFKLEVARQVVRGEKRPAQVCREQDLANSGFCQNSEHDQRRDERFPHFRTKLASFGVPVPHASHPFERFFPTERELFRPCSEF